MRPSCDIHGLALDDQGRCVLCRRERDARKSALVANAARGAGLSVGRVLTLLLVVGVLAAIVGFSLANLRGEAAQSSEPFPEARLQVAPADTRQSGIPAETFDEVPGLEKQAPKPAPRAQLREDDLPPSARDIEQAKQQVLVEMYSTTWCGACRKARSYLRARNIRYVEHDVETSSSARRKFRKLNPRGGVPTFEVDGQVLVGFSSRGIEQARERAAHRRASHQAP